jgi:hypothetical protein
MNDTPQRRAAFAMAQHTELDPRRERRVVELLERWSWRVAGVGAFAAISWLLAQGV